MHLRNYLCLLWLLVLPVRAETIASNPTENPTNMWKTVSFPVDNFQRISSNFGLRGNATGGNGSEFHNGLDLAAPQGSYIRSWADGYVTAVEYDPRCGWHVKVDSTPWAHTYCHISAVAVRMGDLVKAGQVIAAVGTTGRSTGPHLHWTLKYNGQLINPYQVLLEMQKAWQAPPAP
jgi:murein DD-endopeptidase MepM/ murein hydrolase activator NlpD